MSHDDDTCPNLELLTSHLLGQVRGSQAEAVDEHLTRCARCLETLRQLRAQDELTDALRDGVPQFPVSERVLAGIIERGKGLANSLIVVPWDKGKDLGRSEQASNGADHLQLQSDIARNALESRGLGQRPSAHASGDDEPPHLPRFRIERLLGRGGFGKVYLAYDEQLQRPVAVKVLHCRLVANLADAQAYLDEARAVANLHHPNIVPVFDVGRSDHCPYYVVSRYVEGSDLASRLEQGRLSYTESAELVATVAEALHYAHCQGVVHRDVKPGNILLDATGQAHVVDFGLALRDEHVGEGPRFLGSPPYISPEQARGEGHRVDARTDIYGLGAVMYELLTGRPIFQGETPSELLEQIATVESEPPCRVDDSVPKELENICCKAIAKQVDQRYASADLMAQDLRLFLAQQAAVRDAPGGSGFATASETKVTATDSSLRHPVSGAVECPIREESTDDAVRQALANRRPADARRGTIPRPIAKAAAAALLILIFLAGLAMTEATRATKLASTVLRRVTSADTQAVEEPDRVIVKSREARLIRADRIEEDANTAPKPPSLKNTLRGLLTPIHVVVYSPDGQQLAAGGKGTVGVWDTQSGELSYALTVTESVRFDAVTFSPDGKFLLTAPENAYAPAPISIWEADTGKLVGTLEGHAHGLYDLSFSPDGKTLVSGGHERLVRLWDFPTRRKIRDVPAASRWVRSAIFSNQNKIAFGQDKVFLADSEGNLLRTIDKHAGPLCFSPDGQHLAGTTWRQGRVTVWDVNTGEEIASWQAHDGLAEGAAFSRCGNVLATAGGDGRVRLWAYEHQRQLAELQHDQPQNWVAFSPDGTTLAVAGLDQLVKLWDVSALLGEQQGSRLTE